MANGIITGKGSKVQRYPFPHGDPARQWQDHDLHLTVFLQGPCQPLFMGPGWETTPRMLPAHTKGFSVGFVKR